MLLTLGAGPALAQDVPDSSDLRALRYYIDQNETAAIAAELRRLQIAFPGWTPPDDLSTLQPDVINAAAAVFTICDGKVTFEH